MGTTPTNPQSIGVVPPEIDLVALLRAGDETAFTMLLEMYQNAMLRIAQVYVHDREVARDVVQETWIAVLQGIQRFESRSSLKTWIFSILVNRSKTRAQREGRYVPMADLVDTDEPTVEPERFLPADHKNKDHWVAHPMDWDTVPEDHLLSQETQRVVKDTIQGLSAHQREVITLRDVEGLSSEEVCNILQITETNQRVLLHRARAAVRRALEQYFDKAG
jgi:RNA polymerase sigma-70 factor, ECF subfamily